MIEVKEFILLITLVRCSIQFSYCWHVLACVFFLVVEPGVGNMDLNKSILSYCPPTGGPSQDWSVNLPPLIGSVAVDEHLLVLKQFLQKYHKRFTWK